MTFCSVERGTATGGGRILNDTAEPRDGNLLSDKVRCGPNGGRGALGSDDVSDQFCPTIGLSLDLESYQSGNERSADGNGNHRTGAFFASRPFASRKVVIRNSVNIVNLTITFPL